MIAASTKTPLVYILDDDTRTRLPPFLLEIEGFSVRTFHSAEALLKALTIGEADCFVIDYEMPGMSSIGLTGALRQRGINAPIILITGRAGSTLPIKTRVTGIRHVLVRPHLEASLSAEIWDAIDGAPQVPPVNLCLRYST